MNINQINETYDQIRKSLMDQGLSYWEAYEVLLSLDALALSAACDDLVGKLDADKSLGLYDFLKQKPSRKKLSEFLGISLAEIDKKCQEKLNGFITEIPQTVKEYKDKKLQNTSSV